MGNKSLIFKAVPTGLPEPDKHLVVEDRPIDLNAEPPQGGLIVENLYASYDPYLRSLLRAPEIKSYRPALELNSPLSNTTISRVLKSAHPDYREGDLVKAYLPIAEYGVVDGAALEHVQKLENPENLDLGMFLGPLGMPGLTAWAGLQRIGKPKPGETLFVSSAAGAVGQVVGQVAKRLGLKVIGSVGSDAKLDFIINELGFDGGFNYKKESAFDALPRLAPDGIDIYFENVGGEQLDAALANMNTHGRIPVCGMISGYNQTADQRYGVKNITLLVPKLLTMQGFLVSQPEFGPAYSKEHRENVQKWIADGSFKPKLDVTEGIDKAAEGFVGLLKGDNFGKAILKIK